MRLRFFNIVEPVNTFFSDLPPYLADHGFEVEIHISDSIYREARPPLCEILKHPKVDLKYVRVGKAPKTNTFRKIQIFLIYSITIIWRTLFGRTTDLNFFLTQPPLFSSWGIVLKWVRRQKYVVLIMDFYPDVVAHHGVFSEQQITYRLLHTLSRFTLRQSEMIIVIGRCMKDRLLAEGFCEDRIVVIPNWIDERIIYEVPHDENPLRTSLGLDDKFVVLYSGNMGIAHSFGEILRVAQALAYRDDLRFVFIGGGYRRSEIEQFIIEHKLTNVQLLPFQPLEILHQSQSMGNIHFVSLQEGAEGLMVPSKAYGAFSAARPILYLGNAKGEIAREILDADLGTVVQPKDINGLKTAIERYLDDPTLAKRQGQQAQQYLNRNLSRQHAIEQYRQVLQSIIRSE